jgi:hypothetical protein
MKASMKALVAVLTIGSLGLAAGSASACGGGGGYGGYGGYSNYHKKVYVKKVYVQPIVVEPCYYPQHCFAIVCPGDTWFTLSLREYGRPHLWKKIAIFNGLPLNAGLAAGMQLRLPEIHPNGALLPSSAPAPVALAAPAGLPQAGGFPNGGIPQANFIPQGGSQFGPTGPQANFGPQAGGLPQGANFAAPQGLPTSGATMNAPSMNAPAFGGAPNGTPNFGTPNGAPSMFQGNGPTMTPNAVPNMSQPKIDAPTVDAAPTANIRTVSTEERLPSVAIGSILTLDGQSLGDGRGSVRLVVNGLALPVEVLEWNASVVKVQLPQLDLAGALKAQIEVLRADGSLASKSAVELTPATNRLALSN